MNKNLSSFTRVANVMLGAIEKTAPLVLVALAATDALSRANGPDVKGLAEDLAMLAIGVGFGVKAFRRQTRREGGSNAPQP